MNQPRNRKRTRAELRNKIDDFLNHIRFVVRQDWNDFEVEELGAAKARYARFADEVWDLMMEEEHPQHCPSDICLLLRVAEDR